MCVGVAEVSPLLHPVNRDAIVDEDRPERLRRGSAKRYGLRVGETAKQGVAHLFSGDKVERLTSMMRFDVFLDGELLERRETDFSTRPKRAA